MRNKLVGTIVVWGMAVAVKANAVLRGDPSGLFVSFGDNRPGTVVMAVTSMLLGLAGSVGLLYLIIGGFYYITSGANEDLAKQGKKYVQNSIIGLIIIVLSYTIVSVVYRTLVRP